MAYKAINDLGLYIGEDHPNAKYTDAEVDTVLALRDQGLGWKRISRLTEIPKRTVRDICNGRRRCQASIEARWVPDPE